MTRPDSVLVLEPPFVGGSCSRLAGDGPPASVLSVLYRDSVADRRRAITAAGPAVESAAVVRADPTGSAAFADSPAVRVVPDPADLGSVDAAVARWLRARGADERPVVCLEGVSTMLQYVTADRAGRFLEGVVTRCRSAGARVHAHLDPSAHDERTVAAVRRPFDAERRVEPDVTPGPATGAGTAAATRGEPSDS